jgi:S1-C subfamily serine protease
MSPDFEQQIISTVKKILPAVVSIAIAKDPAAIKEEIFRNPFTGLNIYPEELEAELKAAPHDEKGRIRLGGGSGFFVSQNGIVLTNKHVIADPNASYSVVTSDGKNYEAAVLARDPINDIAILKIDVKNCPIVKLEETEKLDLGQTVIAIGNALGQFQNSVSTGIVAGLSRLISAVTDLSGKQERLRGLIQTDAAINPGNSGGPLVNLKGNAIGINSAIVFGAQNIGFAIPVKHAKKDLDEIEKFGRIRRPFIGLRYVLLNDSLQEKFNLPLNHGALVINEGLPGDTAIIKGSPADKAGIQEFDIITHCDGKQINQNETLEDIISERKIGDKLKLAVSRKGDVIEKEITLKELRKFDGF